MRIACPNCDAAYDVPTDRLVPGRSVRCARCSTAWAPVPPPSPPAPDPQRPPDPVPVLSAAPDVVTPSVAIPEPVGPADAVAAEPNPPAPAELDPLPHLSSRVPLLGAWIVSLGLIAGLCWALVAYRAVVIKAWPPSERAYAALGLAGQTTAPSATLH